MRLSFLLRYQEGLRPRPADRPEPAPPANQTGRARINQAETLTVTEVGGETTRKEPKRCSLSAFARQFNGE